MRALFQRHRRKRTASYLNILSYSESSHVLSQGLCWRQTSETWGLFNVARHDFFFNVCNNTNENLVGTLGYLPVYLWGRCNVSLKSHLSTITGSNIFSVKLLSSPLWGTGIWGQLVFAGGLNLVISNMNVKKWNTKISQVRLVELLPKIDENETKGRFTGHFQTLDQHVPGSLLNLKENVLLCLNLGTAPILGKL
jgi:hypothetical protein